MFLEDYYSSHDEDLEEEYEAISEGEDDEWKGFRMGLPQ
jgi:hypothetical protein